MEIQAILFQGEGGGLLPPAALELGLKGFKKQITWRGFRVNLHPGPALPAAGQVFAVFRYSGFRHFPSRSRPLPPQRR